MEALLRRLSTEQKVAQLQSRPGDDASNSIPELRVPAFSWEVGWVGKPLGRQLKEGWGCC